YRLRVYEVAIPPLRDRGAGDIRALVDAIVFRHAERRRRPTPALDAALLDRLVRYNWPGNVRELENTLECLIVAAGGDPLLTVRHLPDAFASPAPARRDAALLPSPGDVAAALERHGWRSGSAASELGLSRHQLYRLLKRYGVRSPNAAG